MVRCLVTLCFFFIIRLCFVHSDCNIKSCCRHTEYYWRDYRGEIPLDAIPGGSDRNGNATYIGQVLHTAYPNLIPGEIRPKDKVIHYEMLGFFKTNKNVKILCSPFPNQYEWVPTTTEGVADLEKWKHLVIGGYEADHILYVGRAERIGEVVVGKVNSRFKDPEYRGLYVSHAGNSVKFESFEVLAYDPYVSQVVKDTSGEKPILNYYTINVFN